MSQQLDALNALPRALTSYPALGEDAGLWEILSARIQAEPFNLVASIIFLLAIVHTFLTARFRHWAHEVEKQHAAELKENRQQTADTDDNQSGLDEPVSFKGQVLHFFGEVEAVFGIWVVVLVGAILVSKGWNSVTDYLGHRVNFTEPMFVVVIMAMASTTPILRFAESGLQKIAALGGKSVGAWWLTILIIGPLLGSLITEPGAMTISALLLAGQFYVHRPSPSLAYATVGLLFVSISVGGTLTHFAAPPVLMVAQPWGWNTPFMLSNFGWKAAVGVILSALIYYVIFRKEFARMNAAVASGRTAKARTDGAAVPPQGPRTSIPLWVTLVQIVFMAWTVFVAHYPALFVGGFLFFLAFMQATAHHQKNIELKSPLLVGFFLAGLVIHGGLQGWWIEPVLTSLSEVPLFLGAVALSPFNDNAAITYLATLVPEFTDPLKYAVVAGAVTGGGLTVIANAPNPAGQSILQRFFPDGITPLGLLAGALPPTIIMALCFLFL